MPTLTIAGSVSHDPTEPPGAEPGCYVVLRACRGHRPGRTGGRLFRLGAGTRRTRRLEPIGSTCDPKLDETRRTFGPLDPGVYQAEVAMPDGALVCPLVEVDAAGIRYYGLLGTAPKKGALVTEETR